VSALAYVQAGGFRIQCGLHVADRLGRWMSVIMVNSVLHCVYVLGKLVPQWDVFAECRAQSFVRRHRTRGDCSCIVTLGAGLPVPCVLL
jgi:hypothetical protein